MDTLLGFHELPCAFKYNWCLSRKLSRRNRIPQHTPIHVSASDPKRTSAEMKTAARVEARELHLRYLLKTWRCGDCAHFPKVQYLLASRWR